MKRILLSVLSLLGSIGAWANGVTITNHTPCTYYVILYNANGSPCGHKTIQYAIGPSQTVTFANTSVATWATLTPPPSPPCNTVPTDFDYLVLADAPGTTPVAYVGMVGQSSPNLNFTSATCGPGSITWMHGPMVHVDIN